MAKLLCLDIGSSSVIAGVLDGTKVVKEAPRQFYPSRCDGPKVEVNPGILLGAIEKAIQALGEEARRVDALNMAVMSPAWVAMDKGGRPLTPIVTHQDRRSVEEARALEERIGQQRHLKLCGSRPVPGGISSTTFAWMLRWEPERMAKADLVGHLNTFLHRQWTGARVIDPSNASFTGLYETLTLRGWSAELCQNIGVSKEVLPDVLEADVVAGKLTAKAAARLGLPQGLPVMTGIMDGSAGMLRAGATHGLLFNVVGSTDVLALCTEKPKPHPRLLTRALGIGKKWLAVSTLAAAASSIYWTRDQFYKEMPIEEFRRLVHQLARKGPAAAGGVTFEPYMAGDRTSVEQPKGAFMGLTLATTRENLLSAIIEGLVKASAERLPLLGSLGTKIQPTVMVSGGSDRLDKIFHRDWPGGPWRFKAVTDATMLGLGMMTPREV